MDMDSKLRILYMAQLLYELTDEEHYLSTTQITKLLEERYGITSHRQTIKRDIEVLQAFGFDVQEIKSTQNLYNIVSRKFDVAELRLLIDAVDSAKFITEKKCRELKNKIGSLAGVHQAEILSRSCCSKSLNRADNEKIYIIIDTINEAINRSRKISFTYFKYDLRKEKALRNEGKPYIVSPLSLVWNGDHYYLIGIKEDGSRRNFRVDRIAARPEILKSPSCGMPEDFDINEYLNHTIRMYDGREREVTLKCDNSLIDVILDRFGVDTQIRPNSDGSFNARVNVSVSNVFYGRVFGYGGLIRILGPEDVKNEFNAMFKLFN